MLEKIRVGIIQTSHGIKGEAKVYPTTDDISHFSLIDKCYLISEDAKKEIDTKLISYRKSNKGLICKFENIDSPEEMAKFRAFSIYVDRNNLPELKENENYIGDLIGLDVFSEDASKLGIVKDIFETGANYVLEVEDEVTHKSIFIPYIKDCILDVKLASKKIKVHLLDGLLDL